MKIRACLTSENQNWKTPKHIYDFFIKRNYYDPCPSNPTFDGLSIEWKEYNFVNPPYKDINKWIDKAIEEKNKNKNIVLLIPARTDTKWFKKLIENNAKIYLFQGRLKFNDGKFSAPFPSMIARLSPTYTMYDIKFLTKEEQKLIYYEE